MDEMLCGRDTPKLNPSIKCLCYYTIVHFEDIACLDEFIGSTLVWMNKRRRDYALFHCWHLDCKRCELNPAASSVHYKRFGPGYAIILPWDSDTRIRDAVLVSSMFSIKLVGLHLLTAQKRWDLLDMFFHERFHSSWIVTTLQSMKFKRNLFDSEDIEDEGSDDDPKYPSDAMEKGKWWPYDGGKSGYFERNSLQHLALRRLSLKEIIELDINKNIKKFFLLIKLGFLRPRLP